MPWIILLLVIVSGGGYHIWSQAVILIGIGLWALWRPPARLLPPLLFAPALGLIGLALIQLVPGTGQLQSAQWRDNAYALGIDTGNSLSVQPTVSFEALLLLVAGLFWLIMLGQASRERAFRLQILNLLAVAGAVLGVLVFVLTTRGVANPLAPDVHCFSFLPNRNQMSLVFASTALIAFGLSWQALRNKGTLAWAYLALCLGSAMGLSASLSRAGVVLFLIGVVLWIIARPRRGQRVTRWQSLPAFLMIICLGMFLTGFETLRRVMDMGEAADRGILGYRGLIYSDTLRMIADQPLAGVGLGNFTYVFPQYREASANASRVIHPESDWLWLAAEAGIPALLLLALLTVVVVRMLWRRIRHGHTCEALASMAVLLFILHSFIDVAGHRLGTWMWFAALFSLAWNGGSSGRFENGRPPLAIPTWVLTAVVSRICGLVLAVTGLIWGFAWLNHKPWSSELAVAAARHAVIEVAQGQADPPEALAAISVALERVPLAWTPRFDQAVLLLQEQRYRDAATAFRQARFLHPVSADIALQEGQLWRPISTGHALNAYRVAIQRQITHNGEDPFKVAIRHLSRDPRFRTGLEQLSRQNPQSRIIYLKHQRGEAFLPPFLFELERDKYLLSFDRGDAMQLYLRALREGAAPHLAELFRSDPALEGRYPLAAAIAYGLTGDHDTGRELLAAHIEAPVASAYGKHFTLEFLRGSQRRRPGDHALTLALLQRLAEENRYEEALEVLQRVPNLRDAPTSLLYWRAEMLTRSGRMDDAWPAWLRYLRES